MNKLTVKRSEWLRGETGGQLLRGDVDIRPGLPHGYCIVGLLMREAGIPDSAMDGISDPDELSTDNWATFYAWANQVYNVSSELTSVNDARHINDDAREDRLTNILHEYGIEVTFTD